VLVYELEGPEVISGGVGGGDTRRSVLLRDFHIGSVGKKRKLGEIM